MARLSSIFPPGGSAGHPTRVTLAGSDLDDPASLVFSDPRITATPIPGEAAQFTVTVPADVPPGWVEVRFHGRFGLSNPRVFAISDTPELVVASTHRAAAQAADLPLNTTINGRAEAHAALWFRVPAQSNRWVVVRIEAAELDSRLEPILTLFDLQGRERARSHRGVLELPPTTEAGFMVSVRDATYRGGDEFPFRLIASSGPHLDSAQPQVLRAGETNRVTLLGRNLRDSVPHSTSVSAASIAPEPLEQLEVGIFLPADAARFPSPARRLGAVTLPGIYWRFTDSTPASNPLFFPVVESPAIHSVTPGSDEPVTLNPPAEVFGRFPPERHPATFQWTARKGDVWWLELFSDRWAGRADPILVIERLLEPSSEGSASGGRTELKEYNDQDRGDGGPGYPAGTRDPVGRFEAPEDGTYQVRIRDLLNPLETQPRHPFRFILRAEAPSFDLVAMATAPPPADPNQRPLAPTSLFLRRGETLPLRVLAFRHQGFQGAIDLRAMDLPHGVQAQPCGIAPGSNEGFVLFTASADAATWAGFIRVAGCAASTDSERAITAEAASASILWKVGDYNQEPTACRITRGLAISASGLETAPVQITFETNQPVSLPAGGTAEVGLRITRLEGFKGELKLKARGNPDFDKLPEWTVPAEATHAVIPIPAGDRKPGSYTFFLQTRATGPYRPNPEALAAAEAALKAAEEHLASTSDDDKAQAEAARKAAEDRRNAAAERAKARDESVTIYSPPITVIITPPPAPEAKM